MSCVIEPFIEVEDKNEIVSTLNAFSILNSKDPKMAEQCKDPAFELVYQYITDGIKLKPCYKNKIKI